MGVEEEETYQIGIESGLDPMLAAQNAGFSDEIAAQMAASSGNVALPQIPEA